MLKRGQTIGLVTSCVVTQEEQGQTLAGHNNDRDTCIGGASVGDTVKEGWKAEVYTVQSVVHRKIYETKEEKQQFIHESFQLDGNEILNAEDHRLVRTEDRKRSSFIPGFAGYY